MKDADITLDKHRKFHENLLYDSFVEFRAGKSDYIKKEYQDADMTMSRNSSVIIITIVFDEGK